MLEECNVSIDPSSGRPKLLVLGMGNEILSDDAVGLVALERARKLIGDQLFSVDLHFKEMNTAGLDLLFEIEGFDHLLVVDAYFAEDSVPGRVRVLSLEQLGGASPVDSAHLISLPDALALSRKLGYHTPLLLGAVVVDVGDTCLVFGEKLSDNIAEAAKGAAEEVARLVRDNFPQEEARRADFVS